MYMIGDRVRVLDNIPVNEKIDGCWFDKDMQVCCGKVYTIHHIRTSPWGLPRYFFAESTAGGNRWSWMEAWFERADFEEEIDLIGLDSLL